MRSIEELRRDVDRRLCDVVAAANNAASAEAAETAIWGSLLALGRALMSLFLARQLSTAWAVGRTYAFKSAIYKVVEEQESEIGTKFGKVTMLRPVGRRVDVPRAPRDLPLDRKLGLPGGFTLPVVTLVARLCAAMAFASTRALFKSLFGWSPSSRSVLRIVDAVGKQARPFLQQAEVPEDDGEVLVITVDGKGAPAISSKEHARRRCPRRKRDKNRRHDRRSRRKSVPRVRRAPGKKSKNAKVAAIGVLYTLRRVADGRLEGPVNKRAYGSFVSYRELFGWLHAEAVRRGYGTTKFKKVLFIADGAEIIWTLKAELFPEADECIDWFHIVEKLWKAGKAICRGTRRHRAELERWVAEQKRRLRTGKLDEVLAELHHALANTAVTGPGNKYRREVLAEVLAHFEKNVARMQYARLRAADLEIGSGVVEGAVRHLVGVRLDGPGMRWGRDRAEAVLHLRCVLVNGLWDKFERYLAAHPFRLAGRPAPTRTHDAVVKQAA